MTIGEDWKKDRFKKLTDLTVGDLQKYSQYCILYTLFGTVHVHCIMKNCTF